MKQIPRYIVFVLLPFMASGGFCCWFGTMSGQSFSHESGWSFEDSLNFFVGGLGPAVLGAIIERLSRKHDE